MSIAAALSQGAEDGPIGGAPMAVRTKRARSGAYLMLLPGLIYLVLFAGLLYASYRKIWKNIGH